MKSSNDYFGSWGNVPIDGDVKPFSHINPVRDGEGRTNRKHHFVSVTYMNGFTDQRGRVHVYRTEAPDEPHAVQPFATGYENHYYSQLLPDGTIDSHRFEDLWNSIETVWPDTVRALQARRVSSAITLNVTGMMTIMRVRVPAARDRYALMLQAKLRSQCKMAQELGVLPDELQRYAGQFDTVPVGINPQETLLAMREQMREFGDLCFRLGFEVLHNETDTPFLTSDNPVCSYNPKRPLPSRVPYDHSGEVEMIFPVTAKMLVVGSTKRRPVSAISAHRSVRDPKLVRRLNRTIVQFAYRMTIAQDQSSNDLVKTHAALVPTIRTKTRRAGNEIQIYVTDVFAAKPTLSQYIDTPEKAARLEAEIAQREAGSTVSDK